MRKPVIMFALIICLSACALTAPEGKRELLEDIRRDHTRMEETRDLAGAPVFLKVRAYPRIENGNIFGKSWIFLQVKRESVDVAQLLESLED